MFILVDHEDRENEGDLVIPAQMCTPNAINFMATHGRGLICLALPGERLDALGLPLMAPSNSSRHETAFTVSIEAREGVTTGISAHDRARTVAGRDRPALGPAGHRHARPRLPAARPRRRRAGARRPHRGRGRHRPARRAQPVGRDLRDHERGRHDGAAARPRRLRPAPRAEDRHDLRPDRLPPPLRQPGARDRGHTVTPSTAAPGRCASSPTPPAAASTSCCQRATSTSPEPVLVRMHAMNPLEDLLGVHPAAATSSATRCARSPPRAAASWCCCATWAPSSRSATTSRRTGCASTASARRS